MDKASKLEEEPDKVNLTTCDADQHAEVIERMVRFVKERIQVVWVAMPHITIPKHFTIEMVYCVIILMNS